MSLKNSRILSCLILVFVTSDIFSNYVVTAIRGGDFDYDNIFNYQVSIQKKKSSGKYEHGCGGSIIAKKYILTAAHCFVSKKGQVLDPTDGMRIMAGTSDLEKEGIVRYIDKVFILKTYRHENRLAIDDIAVVKLQKSLFSDQEHHHDIQIIPLYETFDYAKLENQTAIVSGFGLTEPTATTPSVIRKFLEAKITKERNCADLNSIICIFSQSLGILGAQGFCHGDSGGPVVVDDKLLGVVSRGSKADCDMSRRVGKLMLVPHYLDFIQSVKDGAKGNGDIIILPDMKKEAEIIFKPLVSKLR